MITLFFILFFLLFYIYVGYPFLIYVMSKKNPHINEIKQQELPTITLLIAARNEEGIIKKKIENTLELNYTPSKLQVIIMSDGSTDRTNEIVEKYSDDGIELLYLKERHGKTKAQNVGVEKAKGEIVIFSDANAMYVKDALIELAKHFSDPKVSFVSGELCYTNPNESLIGEKENLYWRYEKFIKYNENRVAGITGANGSIYAVRKSAYIPLEHDIISDFMEPLKIGARGDKVVYETNAKSYEEASLAFSEEFARKRRIISRSVYSLMQNAYLLNPFKIGFLAIQIWSHKLLRWLTPVFMISFFILNILITSNSGTLETILYLQVLFYILAASGWLLRENDAPVLFYAPYYFCMINYASLLGLWDFFRGQNTVLWEPIRKN